MIRLSSRYAFARMLAPTPEASILASQVRTARTSIEASGRLNKAAGDLRATSAARIWESEELSLGELADRISVSKARAAQFVKTAEAQKLRAAIAVAIKDASVLLVCRRADDEGISWQFPAGIVKPGVLPATVAVRETLEETGVHCVVQRDLGSRVHPITNVL